MIAFVILLILIIIVLGLILFGKVLKHKPAQSSTGALELEIDTKNKELEILRKKKQLQESLTQVNEQLKQEQTPEKDS